MAHRVKAADDGGYDIVDDTGNVVDHDDTLENAQQKCRAWNDPNVRKVEVQPDDADGNGEG